MHHKAVHQHIKNRAPKQLLRFTFQLIYWKYIHYNNNIKGQKISY